MLPGITEVLVSNGDCLEVAGFEVGTSAQDSSFKKTYGNLKTSTGSTAQIDASGVSVNYLGYKINFINYHSRLRYVFGC